MFSARLFNNRNLGNRLLGKAILPQDPDCLFQSSKGDIYMYKHRCIDPVTRKEYWSKETPLNARLYSKKYDVSIVKSTRKSDGKYYS